jgi:CheY-like chemotaxis protein
MKKPLNILIVEDERDLRDAYELVLKGSGNVISTASDGSQAVEFLSKKTPDVLLLDVYMPVMNGEQVLKSLSESQKKNLKIIVFSNMSDQNLEQRLLESGADQFVLKSGVNPIQLVKLIDDFC